MLPGFKRSPSTPASKGAQGQAIIEVNVGNHRNRGAFAYFRQRVGIFFVGHGHAHNLAAGICQTENLGDARFNVSGKRSGHGLHPNRRAAANRDVANFELLGNTSRDHGVSYLPRFVTRDLR